MGAVAVASSAQTSQRSDPGPSAEQSDTEAEPPTVGLAANDSLQREDVFGVLSNERRRLVLQYLRQRPDDGPAGFRDVVDQVAAWENGTTTDRLDSGNRKCVYTALRQTHLPKLDKLGVVEFDSQRGTVELADAEDVFRYMKYAPERELRWSKLYLALAVLCGASALLIGSGLAPFGGIPAVVVAVGIAVAFGTASLVQMYQSSRIEKHGPN